MVSHQNNAHYWCNKGPVDTSLSRQPATENKTKVSFENIKQVEHCIGRCKVMFVIAVNHLELTLSDITINF